MITSMSLGAGPASVARGFLLEALCASDCYNFVSVVGLPDGCIFVPERDVLIATTRAAAPFFRTAVERTARALHADVVLLRIGEAEDALLPVSVDAALAALPCQTWIEADMALWTDEKSVWLVPNGFGPSISVTADGFSVELLPPYPTLARRASGVMRAAHAMARLLDPVGVR